MVNVGRYAMEHMRYTLFVGGKKIEHHKLINLHLHPKFPEVFSATKRLCVFASYPIPSVYGIFTYIWLIFMVNVGKYTSPMDSMGILVV